MRQLPRLMPALVTPFTTRGDLDRAAHGANLERMSELGVKGYLLAGSTGEGPLLEPGERAALVSEVRGRLGVKPYVSVGIWAESTRQALSQIEEAAGSGADSALVVTPTTLARRFVPAQIAHFAVIADRSPIPVMIYSVPPNTGYALDEGAVLELATHDNIVGMKDSGGDVARISRIAHRSPDDFVVFNGSAQTVALAIAGGAHGAITASANYAPTILLELTDPRRSFATAMAIQERLAPAAASIEAHGVPGVKAAASAAGIDGRRPRSPFKAIAAGRARALAGIAATI